MASEPTAARGDASTAQSSDVEKQANLSGSEGAEGAEGTAPSPEEKDAAAEAPPEEDMRPGAKAGLTVTQFWIALIG